MAKKEVTPKRVLTRILNNKDKEIYMYLSTMAMLKKNCDIGELKKYVFLWGACEAITIKNKRVVACKLRGVLKNNESWYCVPDDPKGVILI